MASGKSLELAKIARSAPDPLCICGEVWSAHLRKDGQLLAKVQKNIEAHRVKGDIGFGGGPRFTRSQIRQMAKAGRS